MRRLLLVAGCAAALILPAAASARARPPVPTGPPPARFHTLQPGDHGRSVCGLQWELQGHRPSHYREHATYPKTRAINCRYGKVTSRSVYRMKYRLGFPVKALNGIAGPDFQAILRGVRARPIFYISRVGNRFPVVLPRPPPTCVEKLIAIEKREVGVEEHPLGSNWGTYGTSTSAGYVVAYQRITGQLGAAWCVSFQQWSLVIEGYGTIADRSAGVFYVTDWGRARGLVHGQASVGALVLFQDQRRPGQGHVGLVIKVGQTPGGSGWFVSIEGNVSNGVHEEFHRMGDRNPVFLYLPGCST